MSEAWTSWEGQVAGLFPLRRYLGSSDHSAVYLSESAAGESTQVALKLIPAIPTLAESQLSCWYNVARLAHPHLIRLLRTGQCELGGLPYIYAVMEYADQSLAQVLRQRALTDDETREMLLPTVSGLAFLHARNLVHRQLKPSNILAVGDQLKLASDTIRRSDDARTGRDLASAYDPPEAREGSYSPAGDIWALGVCLFEALTRSPPPALDEGGGSVAVPHDFSPAFREIVSRCLCLRPEDRPKAAEIEAWVRGQSAGSAPIGAPQPVAPAQVARPSPPAASGMPQPVAARPTAPVATTQVARPSAPAAPRMPQPVAARPTAPVATTQVARPSAPTASAQMTRASAPAAPKMPQSTAARTAAPVATRTAAPVSAVPQAPAPGRATSEASASRPPVQSAQRPALHAVSSEEAVAEPFWNRLFEVWGRFVVPRRFVVPLSVAAVAILVLSWVGLRASRTHRTPAPPSIQAHQNAPSQTPGEAPTAAAYRPATSPVSTGVITRSTPVGGGASPSTIHEEIPDVPPRARHTIRGHIRVSVRVMVDQDGTVFAALVDQPGPSRYFRRLAIEAAKKWTFPPADQPDAPQRLELVRFVFSRQGATAHAIALK